MTSATTPKTIVLQGDGPQQEAPVTNAAITPGMLVTRTAAGVRPHNVAGGSASTHFAIENDLVGLDIDDNYAVGNNCRFKTLPPGSHVYAIVPAGAAAITVGGFLQSDGAGGLIAAAANDVIVAQALESVDNSGGGTAVRIKAEIVPAQTSTP
jgi:hypothetical protein